MKKIVSTTIIVGMQLLVGGLFLVTLFSDNSENNKVVIVENNNLSKMVDTVSGVYMGNVIKSVDTQDIDVKDNEENQVKEDNNEEKSDEISSTNKEEDKTLVVEEDNSQSNVSSPDYNVIETYTGSLTGYGPDCRGCSGKTASGYDVSNTITYNDEEYGEIRILAAGKLFKEATEPIELYSIVRISNVPNMEPFIGIVLDRGGNVGFGKGTLFDLLFSKESEAMHKVNNVTFEILRKGK